MNRKDLQELSKIRLKEAKHLIDKDAFDGAYYLCGYSVECALKACIAKNTRRHDFPEKKAVMESFTHELILLIKIAGLELKFNDEIKNNIDFKINWNIIKDWKESSRYKRNSRLEALDLFSAVSDRKNGVMTWIKKYW
jgi:hypothetical protein